MASVDGVFVIVQRQHRYYLGWCFGGSVRCIRFDNVE